MNKHALQIAISAITGLTALSTQAAVLKMGDTLTITAGVPTYTCSSSVCNVSNVSTGSYFGADTNNDGQISGNEKTPLSQGTQGIVIGEVQPLGSPTHSGAVLSTDSNNIDAPYEFFGSTAADYTASPITGSTETGLDFSGLYWSWYGMSVDFGSGAWGTGYSDGIANFSWDGVYGDAYTLDYRTTVPLNDPSGLGGVRFAYHLEGDVLNSALMPLPDAAWLFGSGLIGLVGVARRKKIKHND